MKFSVLSYNVLHEFGAKRLLRSRGLGIPAWAKDRLSQVAQQVRQLDPDVVCLQEVDVAAQTALERTLGEEFKCAATMRNESLPPKDGCSIFVRGSRFEVEGVHCFRMRDVAGHHFSAVEEVRGRAAGMTAALWRELHEKLNMALALQLRAKDGGADLCVATTHLFWDPRFPDLKLLQAFFLAKELESFAKGRPLILAGDLNSTPYTPTGSAMSGVYTLLTQGEVLPGHPDHPVALRRASGILAGVSPADVPELTVAPFQSAYQEAFGMRENLVTNVSLDFKGCLDYVLYRGDGLGLLGARRLPSDVELTPLLPLPSPEQPSDHFPLLAEFELSASAASPLPSAHKSSAES